MNDGIIENNSGYRGAGVFVIGREFKNRASMTMNGGTIRNNICQGFSDAQAAGAGVYVQQNAEFTMNDGEISGNTVDMGEGGGICVACGWESVAGTPGWNIDLFSLYYPAAFTMNGGTIRDNHAKMNTEQGTTARRRYLCCLELRFAEWRRNRKQYRGKAGRRRLCRRNTVYFENSQCCSEGEPCIGFGRRSFGLVLSGRCRAFCYCKVRRCMITARKVPVMIWYL